MENISIEELLGSTDWELPTFYVDVVFVIDATESMEQYLDGIRKQILVFYDEFRKIASKYKRDNLKCRIKVIWFRDFYFDGKYAYGESEFFRIPEEMEGLKNFIEKIEAKGGYDKPESSLEALVMAMRSDFTQEEGIKRHVIALFTDSEAHPFEERDALIAKAKNMGCEPELYPENMPSSLLDFYEVWSNWSNWRNLYYMVAPHVYPWIDMESNMEHVILSDMFNVDEFYGIILHGY